MINTKTLKLSKKERRGTIKLTDVLKISKRLERFEPISEEKKEIYRKEIEEYKEKIRNLNITDVMRSKRISELTEEEKDKLYDEYVYKSLIDSSRSIIKYGTCDIKYLFEEIEEKYGVTRY